MSVKETLETLAARVGAAGVRTIYGEPVTAEGRTIIPVARVAYGFGGGSASPPQTAAEAPHAAVEGGGGGGGVRVTPMGVVEITRDETRFVRFNDWRRLSAAALVGCGVALLVTEWRDRRREGGLAADTRRG